MSSLVATSLTTPIWTKGSGGFKSRFSRMRNHLFSIPHLNHLNKKVEVCRVIRWIHIRSRGRRLRVVLVGGATARNQCKAVYDSPTVSLTRPARFWGSILRLGDSKNDSKTLPCVTVLTIARRTISYCDSPPLSDLRNSVPLGHCRMVSPIIVAWDAAWLQIPGPTLHFGASVWLRAVGAQLFSAREDNSLHHINPQLSSHTSEKQSAISASRYIPPLYFDNFFQRCRSSTRSTQKICLHQIIYAAFCSYLWCIILTPALC